MGMTILTIPLADLLARYEQEYVVFSGHERTVAHYRLQRLQNYFGADVTDVHPAEVDRFFQSLASKSPATRNRYRALLGHLLKWGFERGLVEGVLPKLKLEPENNERTRRLAHQEEEQLARLMDEDLRLLFYAALDTGLRRGALLKLVGRDVRDGALVVPASIQKQRRSQIIPLSRRLLASIEERKPGPREPLFPVYNFREKWDRVRKAVGCEDLHWHDLRGEFASRLDEHGVEVSVTSRLLGHASLNTTQRYLRPRVERFRDAIDKLGV